MNTYRRILAFVRPYWKHLVIAIICTVFFSFLHGASIYLSIPLLDTLFQQAGNNSTKVEVTSNVAEPSSILPDFITKFANDISNTFHHYMFSGDITDVLLRISFLILIAFLGKSIFAYLQAYFLVYVQQGVIKDIRNAAYEHLHKLPIGYFKNERTGDLMSRIIHDSYTIQNGISDVFISLIREPITILVFTIIAISISWKLFLFSLIILPFSILIIGWIGIIVRKQSKIMQQQMGRISSIIHETISGVKIVKAFGMEDFENSKFRNETLRYFRIILRIMRIRNIASPATELIAVMVGVIIIYYGGILVLVDKTIKASEFLGFLFAVFQMIPPMKQVATINNKIQESMAAGERIFEILDTEPNIKNVPNSKIIKDFTEKIEFKNVSFKYDNSDELILDNISVEANRGEIIALVGSSGAGKTTFVDLIPRFYDPLSGLILLDGNDIKEIELKSLRSLMGIVTQETVLFNESVKSNIAYGLSSYPMEKIIEVAKIANAHEFIENLPEGYDTIIGEQGTKLSGGQRQRLSIARALLKNPPIMIFDEATSALDNESEVLVQEAIERLMKERTTFVIAHRLSTIRNADKIIVLEKGKIVQIGKHDELLNDENGIYKKLYELQFRNGQ
jgi:subfamily B ATP-binding cassette protein MsbA